MLNDLTEVIPRRPLEDDYVHILIAVKWNVYVLTRRQQETLEK